MTDPFSAWGNAEKEKWKAVQKAIPLTNRLGNFLGVIIGPAASNLGGLLGDQMKAWRAANLDRIARKWQVRVQDGPIASEVIRQLPFRESIALIDAASQEDDEDVQELWASLIANATSINAKVEISKMHIDLLKSLNGLEARVLMVVFALFDEGNFAASATKKQWKAALKRWPKLTSEQLRVCLQNLQRLGLLVPNITEMEILKHNTFEEWQESVNEDNIVDEFKRVVTDLVLEITNLTGNPMNDAIIPNKTANQIELIESYTLTRIGFDLYEATSPKSILVREEASKVRSRRRTKPPSA